MCFERLRAKVNHVSARKELGDLYASAQEAILGIGVLGAPGCVVGKQEVCILERLID